MKKRNIRALIIFGLFYICFGVYITLTQERIVYYPNAQNFADCPALSYATQVVHSGTRMYVHDTGKPIAVLYHGNAGSACDRAFYADLFVQAGFDFIIVEYAGYSNGTVQPTHERLKEDVRHVIEYLTTIGTRDGVVVGESIGTGFAAYHASLAPSPKLILISSFTNLKDIAAEQFWFYPTSVMVNDAYNNVGMLSEYSGSALSIHGTEDTIIPFHLGKELFDTLASAKQLVPINGGGHNDLFMYPETEKAILNFLTLE